MNFGTFIKLFDYAIPGYKSNIMFDLNYRMSMLLPDLAHPIRLRECRRGYSGHTLESTISGLETRLYDDRQNNIEEGFPSSSTFNIDGQSFRCSIYVFKKGRSENYREKDGVLFAVNGQTHACIQDSFFNKVNLSYLADSLLVLVDCSDMDISHREDMFMNSRDRLRNAKFSKDVEDRIKEVLKEQDGLRELQNRRRLEAIQNKLSDDQPFQNVLENILSKSPVLSKILLAGGKISSPFNTMPSAGEQKTFKGKKHPTFFDIKGKLTDGVLIKSTPINHDFRIQFETDVENDYFARPTESGKFMLYYKEQEHPELIKHLGLFNGTATATIIIPDGTLIGDKINFSTEIIDDYITQHFKNTFTLIACEEAEYRGGIGGERKPPKDDNHDGQRQKPAGVAIPIIKEVDHTEWESFDMNKTSALILRTTEEGNDYFLNMDNEYFLTELKGMRDQSSITLTRARYKYSMALIGMSVASYYKQNPPDDDNEDDDNEDNATSAVKKVSSMIAPILIPMLDAMSDLSIDDI